MQRIILIIIIFFSTFLNANAGYEVNQNCKTAWMLLMDLKIEEAKQLLAKEILINPENYYAYYLNQSWRLHHIFHRFHALLRAPFWQCRGSARCGGGSSGARDR